MGPHSWLESPARAEHNREKRLWVLKDDADGRYSSKSTSADQELAARDRLIEDREPNPE